MKLSERRLLSIIDSYASGLSYNQSAKLNGLSPRQFWEWMKRSNEGDPAYLVPYNGETMQFCRAIATLSTT